MAKLAMCRICLAEDVRMQLITATHIHELYEALTTMPFETEDSRPLQVCYICCARLQNCYKLKMQCLQSEELFSQMLNKKLKTGCPSKPELSLVKVLQVSFDEVQSPQLCYQVKVEYEKSEATTSDIVDAGRDEHFQFSNVEEQEMIDIIKNEPDEQTSAPVPKQHALLMQTNETLSNFKKCEKSEDLVEELKTNTEIALEDNILQTHNERDRDVNKSNKTNSLADHNNVEKETFKGISLLTYKPYSCNSCPRSFHRKYNYEKHIRRHISEIPYRCNVCKKCFSVKRYLDSHIRIHTDEKPYQCHVCKKCFSQKTYLVKHLRTHTGEKPYQCDVCMKCCSQKTDLIRHIRKHTGEKPYQCKVCTKCFSRKSALNKHIRTHNGEKPHECKKCLAKQGVCKKCLIRKGDLKLQIRKHTLEKLL